MTSLSGCYRFADADGRMSTSAWHSCPAMGVIFRLFSAITMEARILRPLQWFGLLEHREDGTESRRFERRHLYRKTALLDRFLPFEVRLEARAYHEH
jgi:hypothetical protein